MGCEFMGNGWIQRGPHLALTFKAGLDLIKMPIKFEITDRLSTEGCRVACGLQANLFCSYSDI